jgi:hypothetical protein
VNNPVGKIAQQVKIYVGNLGTTVAKSNQENVDSGNLKTQFVGMYQTKKAEELKVTHIGGQLYQLVMLLNQVQRDL